MRPWEASRPRDPEALSVLPGPSCPSLHPAVHLGAPVIPHHVCLLGLSTTITRGESPQNGQARQGGADQNRGAAEASERAIAAIRGEFPADTFPHTARYIRAIIKEREVLSGSGPRLLRGETAFDDFGEEGLVADLEQPGRL